MKKGTYKKCKWCGNEFYQKPYMVRHHPTTYCSMECRSKHNKSTKKKWKCLNCGNEFISGSFDERKFCSRECCFIYKANHKKVGTRKVCQWCKKEFYIANNALDKNQKFCGVHCYYLSKEKKTEVVCSLCGKTVERTDHYINKNKNFYCSRSCLTEHWSIIRHGKSNPNFVHGKCKDRKRYNSTIRYKRWRKDVFTRDKYICQKCGAKNALGKTVYLIAHHKVGWHESEDLRYDVDNGQTVCRDCHYKIHSKYYKTRGGKGHSLPAN